jgi:hypothetical protein
MKKVTMTIIFALAMSVIGLTFLTTETKVAASSTESSNFSFGDPCTNVRFSGVNLHNQNGQIKLKAVKVYNRASGSWHTIDLPGKIYGQGQTFTTQANNVPDSEGEDLTKVKFVYQWKGKGRGATWSNEVNSKEFNPASPTCNANKTFGGPNWEIGN